MNVGCKLGEEESSQEEEEEEKPLLKEITERISFFLNLLTLRECMNNYITKHNIMSKNYYQRFTPMGILKKELERETNREEKVDVKAWYFHMEKTGLLSTTRKTGEIWLTQDRKYKLSFSYWSGERIEMMIMGSEEIESRIHEKQGYLKKLAFNK